MNPILEDAKKPDGEIMPVKGDILYCCWGSTMTLYDFFEVLKVTDKSITTQMLKKRRLGGPQYAEQVQPIRGQYEFRYPKKTARVRDGYFKPAEARYCSVKNLWDGVSSFEENHMD